MQKTGVDLDTVVGYEAFDENSGGLIASVSTKGNHFRDKAFTSKLSGPCDLVREVRCAENRSTNGRVNGDFVGEQTTDICTEITRQFVAERKVKFGYHVDNAGHRTSLREQHE